VDNRNSRNQSQEKDKNLFLLGDYSQTKSAQRLRLKGGRKDKSSKKERAGGNTIGKLFEEKGKRRSSIAKKLGRRV